MSLFDNTGADQSPKLEDLVGEGKKFKSVEDLARAKIEADNFIAKIKAENEELRREVTVSTRPAVDRTQEILDRMEALFNKPVTERQPVPQEPERTEVKGLTAKDVEDLLIQRERQAQAERNLNTVKTKLAEVYGDKYGDALKSMAEKNGLTASYIDQLAATAPQVVLNLMAQQKPDGLFTPPQSAVNVNFAPTAGPHKTKSWYNQLKATDRAKYFSKEVQLQMYNDAMALKEAFEDAS
jgi:hypothetical protein